MPHSFPLYNQYDSMDCGPSCLRMIIKYYGKNVSLKNIRDRSFLTKSGVSLLGISEAAESLGFHTLPGKVTFETLKNERQFPCIAHWKQNHFVVIYNITKKINLLGKRVTWIYVADPAAGLVKYQELEFKKAWISSSKKDVEEGICLFLEPTPDFYSIDEDDSNPKSTYRYLYSYVRPYKPLLIQLLLGFLIGSIFSLIAPFLTQAIVDKGINYKDLSFLTIILSAQLAMTFGNAAVGFIRGWIMLHLTTRINISMVSTFLMNLMKLPIAFFDNKMTGDIIQRIEDNKRIETFLTSTAINLIFSLLNFIVFSIVIVTYSIPIFVIFLIGSLLYILWIRLFLSYRRQLDNRRFAQQSNNQSNIIELIQGMQEIKLNNCEKRKRWEWERIQTSLFKIGIKGLMLGQYQNAGATILNSSKNFVITYLVAKSVINGEMSLGMMLSIQYIIGQLNGPIESLVGFIQNWQDAKMSFERLDDIQSEKKEDEDFDNLKIDLDDSNHIHFDDVSFQYEGPNSPFALKNVNFKIPENKVTAIVGTSGSGKTTLLKLILGYYLNYDGKIKVGELDLKSIYLKSWRNKIGTVLQDGFVFSDTIAKNIAVSDESIDIEKLRFSAEIANIGDFIKSLPLGYNTKIGSVGNGISQGQKQRILIARAIYKKPQILLFDEATNALDSSNELQIVNNLNSFFRGRTVVVVAHRLSTVRNADNIIVLEKGVLVEQGTHTELVNKRGQYYNLVKNQLELGN